jgi:drug/metabolite transporter (DMT)-like permease
MTPILRGTLIALAAALMFGVTTPLVRTWGSGVGPFSTATLLYAGAALGAGARRRGQSERPLGVTELGRVVLVAFLGATLAPASLAWGLQHTGALSASLLLNLEAVFTVLLARVWYREPLGARVVVAVLLMLAGGALLAFRAGAEGQSTLLGLSAIVAATLAWSLDNTLTRPLADFDPRAVVVGKATLGGLLSAAAAGLLGEAWPDAWPALGLLLCGATGYGLSLRFYLGAQRLLGAARTGSLFACAPFVGAALAFALGEREQASLVALSALFFGAAVYLHGSERHEHRHRHEAVEHDHPHRHDDGHHWHVHEPAVVGEHSHSHRHEAVEHDHPHAADLHHRHRH